MTKSRRKVFASNEKWENSIKESAPADDVLEANTQFIPVDFVQINSDFLPPNTRRLRITIDDVKKGPKIQAADPHSIILDQEDDYWASFEKNVISFFGDDIDARIKIEEYLSIAQLAISIGSYQKLLQPVEVIQVDSSFFVTYGQRRTLAHVMSEQPKIWSIIRNEVPSTLNHLLNQWKENEDREDVPLRDKINHIRLLSSYWKDEEGSRLSVDRLAKILALGRTFASYYLAVIKVDDPHLNHAIDNGQIESLKVAYKIAGIKNPSARKKMLDVVLAESEDINVKKALTKISNIQKNKEKNENVHRVNISDVPKNVGLKFTKKTNFQAVSKIIEAALDSPQFADMKSIVGNVDFENLDDVVKVWVTLYENA